MRRWAVGTAMALALAACLPVIPATAGAARKAPSIGAGSYGRLASGTAVRPRDLRQQPSIGRPGRSTPLIVRNPAAYPAKAATGRAIAGKTKARMRAASPLAAQGTVEEQLT